MWLPAINGRLIRRAAAMNVVAAIVERLCIIGGYYQRLARKPAGRRINRQDHSRTLLRAHCSCRVERGVACAERHAGRIGGEPAHPGLTDWIASRWRNIWRLQPRWPVIRLNSATCAVHCGPACRRRRCATAAPSPARSRLPIA
jgi:hypothetical protein